MIILFNPRSTKPRNRRFPLSVLALAAVLEGREEYAVVDGNVDLNPVATIVDLIDRNRVELLGVTVMPGPQMASAMENCREIRALRPKVPIAWGGYFPSIYADAALNAKYVDYAVRGQGEDTLLELLDVFRGKGKLDDIKGLSHRDIFGLHRHNPERLMKAPDAFPVMPFHAIPVEKYLRPSFFGRRTAAHQASIGCPFKCSFCGVHAAYGNREKMESPARTESVLRHLATKYGADSVQFYDMNFFLREDHTRDLCDRLAPLNLRWWCEGRIDTVVDYSDSTLEAIRRAGCSMIFFGAESGSDWALKEMQKGITTAQTLELAERICHFGIIPEFSFVIGNPRDPERDTAETLAFIRKIKRINPKSEIISVKTGGVVWDSGIPDHNIPDSLFLAQKPAWFGTLTYPPIDPTRPNLTPTSIPAGYRYINGTDPPTGTANQAPKTSVSATPASGIAPLVVTFSSEGTYDPEGATLTYKWDFGDGTSSSAANPSKTYQNPGNYTVRLTASDGVLSTDSTSLSISVLAPRTGLVAAFAFDEGSGTSTQDSSGNGNEGTIIRASWVDGKYGNALAFNGTDALVSANSSASLAFTSAVTVEAWVYPQAASAAWRPIAFKAFDASRIGYVLQGVTPQSVAAFFVYPSTGNLVSPSALPVNTWSHLAGTYDGTTMRMYVNGVEISSKAQTGVLNVSTEPLTIGGSTLYGAYWNGLIDEVRVYSRAISPSEIQSDMATPIRPAPPTGLHVK